MFKLNLNRRQVLGWFGNSIAENTWLNYLINYQIYSLSVKLEDHTKEQGCISLAVTQASMYGADSQVMMRVFIPLLAEWELGVFMSK